MNKKCSQWYKNQVVSWIQRTLLNTDHDRTSHFCIDQPQLKGKQYITVSFHIGPWNKAWVSNITMPITGHCQSEMCQFWHLYCTTPQMQLTCCSLLIPSLSPQLYLSCVRRLTFKDQQNGADVTQELVSHSCLFRGSSKEHSISHTCTKYKGLLHVNMWTVEWFKCLNGILLRWFSKNITLLIKNVYESHCRGRPYAFWASAVEGRQKDSKQEWKDCGKWGKTGEDAMLWLPLWASRHRQNILCQSLSIQL